jgi:hypothetical protein
LEEIGYGYEIRRTKMASKVGKEQNQRFQQEKRG